MEMGGPRRTKMATSDEDTLAHHLDRMLADSEADTIRQLADDRAWAATATWDDVDALARKLVAANEAADAGVAGAWKESVRCGQRLATVHEVRRMDPRQLKAAGLVIRGQWPGELIRGWTIRVLIKVTDDLRETEKRGSARRAHTGEVVHVPGLPHPVRLAPVREPGMTRAELDSLVYSTDFEWAVAQVLDDLRAVVAVGVRRKMVRPKRPAKERQDGAKTPAQRSPRLRLTSEDRITAAIEEAVRTFLRPRRRGRPVKANEGSPGDAMVNLWRELDVLPHDTLPLGMANKAIARELASVEKWAEREWAKTSEGWAPRK